MDPKIFEFSIDTNEKDWVIAEDLGEAKEFYAKEMGLMPSDLDEININEVPKDNWSNMSIVDWDEPEPEEGERGADYNPDEYDEGYLCLGTFESLAQGYTTPEIIATTDH